MEIASQTISLKNAALLEKSDDLKAFKMYEILLKKAPSDLKILTRLMIVSRKLKKYKQEITYINKAIKIQEMKYAILKSRDVKVVSLSKQLNTLLGHTDKKGNNLLIIPEVGKLKKRKAVAEKRKK